MKFRENTWNTQQSTDRITYLDSPRVRGTDNWIRTPLERVKSSEDGHLKWSSWKEQWLCTSLWLHVYPKYSGLNPDCPTLHTTTVLFHLLLRCLQVVSRLCFLRSCPPNGKWLHTDITGQNLFSIFTPDPFHLVSSSRSLSFLLKILFIMNQQSEC
jgi:hypothetical protein